MTQLRFVHTEWQRLRQQYRYRLNFIITNRFIHNGAAMAMAPQVNGFQPYSVWQQQRQSIISK